MSIINADDSRSQRSNANDPAKPRGHRAKVSIQKKKICQWKLYWHWLVNFFILISQCQSIFIVSSWLETKKKQTSYSVVSNDDSIGLIPNWVVCLQAFGLFWCQMYLECIRNINNSVNSNHGLHFDKENETFGIFRNNMLQHT